MTEATCGSALVHTTNCQDVIRPDSWQYEYGARAHEILTRAKHEACSRAWITIMYNLGAEDGGPSELKGREEEARKEAPGPCVPSQGVPVLPTLALTWRARGATLFPPAHPAAALYLPLVPHTRPAPTRPASLTITATTLAIPTYT